MKTITDGYSLALVRRGGSSAEEFRKLEYKQRSEDDNWMGRMLAKGIGSRLLCLFSLSFSPSPCDEIHR